MLVVLILFIVVFLVYSIIPTYFYKVKSHFKRNKKEKQIFLTFDDGPSKYTNNLLDLLKKYNIKVTFFMVAQFASNNPQIVDRIKEEGHIVALHSYAHKNGLIMLPLSVEADFKNSMNIFKNLNIKINYYRAPWGHLNLCILNEIKKNNLKLVLWDVMVGDWNANITSDMIAYRLLKKIKNGSLICLHDGRGKNEAPKRTIAALKEVIPILLKEGYQFKTVDLYGKEGTTKNF